MWPHFKECMSRLRERRRNSRRPGDSGRKFRRNPAIIAVQNKRGGREMPEIELHYLGKAWQIGDSADPSVIIAKAEAGAPQQRYEGSLTALGTALMRAAHTRLDPSPLIDDSWGDRLVPKLARAAFRDTA